MPISTKSINIWAPWTFLKKRKIWCACALWNFKFGLLKSYLTFGYLTCSDRSNKMSTLHPNVIDLQGLKHGEDFLYPWFWAKYQAAIHVPLLLRIHVGGACNPSSLLPINIAFESRSRYTNSPLLSSSCPRVNVFIVSPVEVWWCCPVWTRIWCNHVINVFSVSLA